MKKPPFPGSLQGQLHVPDDLATPLKEIEDLFYGDKDGGEGTGAVKRNGLDDLQETKN